MTQRITNRMLKKLIVIIGTITLVTQLAWAKRKPEPAKGGNDQFNVILISLDTLRLDYVGLYGQPFSTSPFLDRLSKESLWFRECIVQAPWTLASHMSMLTSQYPSVHNVNVAEAKLSPDKLMIQKYLLEQGWRTVGIYSNPFLGGYFGFIDGFEIYKFVGMDHGFQSTEEVMKWLENPSSKQPFFLFLHYNDPHIPYGAPEQYLKLFDPDYEGTMTGATKDIVAFVRKPLPERDLEHVRNLYRGEVRYLDHQLKTLFEALKDHGLYDETLIVITADHGEEFKEHGKLEHNDTMYDELLRVPLLIKTPKSLKLKPKIIDHQVKNIDIAPTILTVLELPIPPNTMQGDSLLPLIKGKTKAQEHNDVIFAESPNTRVVGIRTSNWKYVYDRNKNREELYDLEQDPQELVNLAQERADIIATFSPLAHNYIMHAQSGWHLRATLALNFRARLLTTGEFTDVSGYSMGSEDSLTLSDDKQTLEFEWKHIQDIDTVDGVDFKLSPATGDLTLEIIESDPIILQNLIAQVYIGQPYTTPKSNPIVLNGEGKVGAAKILLNEITTVDKGSRNRNAGVYIWYHDESEQGYLQAEIDEETRQNLESLGYFR